MATKKKTTYLEIVGYEIIRIPKKLGEEWPTLREVEDMGQRFGVLDIDTIVKGLIYHPESRRVNNEC